MRHADIFVFKDGKKIQEIVGADPRALMVRILLYALSTWLLTHESYFMLNSAIIP